MCPSICGCRPESFKSCSEKAETNVSVPPITPRSKVSASSLKNPSGCSCIEKLVPDAPHLHNTCLHVLIMDQVCLQALEHLTASNYSATPPSWPETLFAGFIRTKKANRPVQCSATRSVSKQWAPYSFSKNCMASTMSIWAEVQKCDC